MKRICAVLVALTIAAYILPGGCYVPNRTNPRHTKSRAPKAITWVVNWYGR